MGAGVEGPAVGRARLRVGAAALAVALTATVLVAGAGAVGDAGLPPGLLAPILVWQHRLPGVVFRESSPVDARLDTRAVVVGAHNGQVYAYDLASGATEPGWPAKTSHPINSSPAAADIDGTRHDVIFVGSGYADRGPCSGGGMYAFNANGRIRWHINESDPTCPSLAFHSSPVVGDITGNGTPDVTVGALGLRAFSFAASTGQLNPGWPYLTDDTVFSTPALADVQGVGVPSVVMGGDSSPGGVINHRGGLLRVIRGDGRTVWQQFTDEMVRSSPAIGDLDGNGTPTIVYGTGNYWSGQPGGSKDATKLFATTLQGRVRWSRDLGGITMGSPALADITGSGHPAVIIGTAAGPAGGEVWAMDANGNPLPHWAGHPSGGGVVIGGITTVDLNGDGAQDLLVPTGRGVFAYDGVTGGLLFTLGLDQVGFQNSPLVTDDGGGAIGVTVAGTSADGVGYVQHWRISSLAGARLGGLGWPEFHHDARHTGNLSPPVLGDRRCSGLGVGGYWMAAGDGGVFAFCGATFQGSANGLRLRAPIVSLTSTPSGKGYWLTSADGGVFAYGDAGFHGSVPAGALSHPIVAMARTPSGRGYWLASGDGGVFAFGDAPYLGSAGSVRLPVRVVAIVPTVSGLGYWLVGAEGTILTYGDAAFYGAPNGLPLHAPIVGAARTPTGLGYWLVGSDGGVFTYGDASYWGSTGALALNRPITAMAPTAAGRGYWLIAADGGVFAFGDAQFLGSTARLALNSPVQSMAAPSG